MTNILQLYINGEWVGGTINNTCPVINPATEEIISHVYMATKENLDVAINGANEAFKKWSTTSAQIRSEILHKAAEILSGQINDIASNLTIEQGKPIGEATGEVHAAVNAFRWASKEALNIKNITYPDSPDNYSQKTMFEPIGVVAGFSPWNFPAMLTARKISSAIAAGCCIIIKPAEEAPATAITLAKALDEAGLPAGVLNMVFGDPAMISERLIRDKSIKKVSLTGSTAVGKLLAGQCAQNLTPCVLELGGHAPVIIFDDVDVNAVAQNLAIFKYRNAGQVCVSPSRFFIHENIAEKFMELFVKHTENLKVGNGLDSDTNIGPLAHERRVGAVEELVNDAIGKGANCLLGGKPMDQAGYFFEPTILSNAPKSADLMTTEIFGPVAVLSTFNDVDDVIDRANDVPYGLASYLFTNNAETIEYIKPRLEAGLVSINITTPILENVPFGGVKESGYGYEGGTVGLQAFMNLKLIHEA
ncbi:MAG: NAD-dependent succinate-semialdehyde dehydrogenase [Emcibacteraceae bacterium]|nr:NAD-dependent succinate-semialdehyde dehydrogenase [Emcibacteraceae bacterium]MDG1726034.1 NAD-dependent succinate-semialdehyde dehydrogenase [Emcibacteraceae bacterium]